MPQTILALCGPTSVGKSTLATQLKTHGYILKKFAGGLKLMLAAFLMDQGRSPADIDRMLEGDLREVPALEFIGKTPRFAMQTLGTEWRDLIGKTLWTEAWKRSIEPFDKIVVDDLRFIHEADAVRNLGGKIILVTRYGHDHGNHASEYEYLSIIPDFTVSNDGTPEDMLHQLETSTL